LAVADLQAVKKTSDKLAFALLDKWSLELLGSRLISLFNTWLRRWYIR